MAGDKGIYLGTPKAKTLRTTETPGSIQPRGAQITTTDEPFCFTGKTQSKRHRSVQVSLVAKVEGLGG